MYSKWVRLIFAVACLCFGTSVRKGIQAVLEILSYDSGMEVAWRVAGHGAESMHSYYVRDRLNYAQDEILQCIAFGGVGLVGLGFAKFRA